MLNKTLISKMVLTALLSLPLIACSDNDDQTNSQGSTQNDNRTLETSGEIIGEYNSADGMVVGATVPGKSVNFSIAVNPNSKNQYLHFAFMHANSGSKGWYFAPISENGIDLSTLTAKNSSIDITKLIGLFQAPDGNTSKDISTADETTSLKYGPADQFLTATLTKTDNKYIITIKNKSADAYETAFSSGVWEVKDVAEKSFDHKPSIALSTLATQGHRTELYNQIRKQNSYGELIGPYTGVNGAEGMVTNVVRSGDDFSFNVPVKKNETQFLQFAFMYGKSGAKGWFFAPASEEGIDLSTLAANSNGSIDITNQIKIFSNPTGNQVNPVTADDDNLKSGSPDKFLMATLTKNNDVYTINIKNTSTGDYETLFSSGVWNVKNSQELSKASSFAHHPSTALKVLATTGNRFELYKFVAKQNTYGEIIGPFTGTVPNTNINVAAAVLPSQEVEFKVPVQANEKQYLHLAFMYGKSGAKGWFFTQSADNGLELSNLLNTNGSVDITDKFAIFQAAQGTNVSAVTADAVLVDGGKLKYGSADKFLTATLTQNDGFYIIKIKNVSVNDYATPFSAGVWDVTKTATPNFDRTQSGELTTLATTGHRDSLYTLVKSKN